MRFGGTNMPCVDGYDGIFGAAYKNLDTVRDPAPAAPSTLYLAAESSAAAEQWCNVTPVTTEYVNPLQTALRQTASAAFGLQWNGQTGPNTGFMYIGASARDNDYYNVGGSIVATLGGSSATSRRVSSTTTSDGSSTSFAVTVVGYNVGPTYQSEETVGPGATGDGIGVPGFLDVGTPAIQCPADFYEAVLAGGVGLVTITLDGPDGLAVLSLGPADALTGQLQLSESGQWVLGLPLWEKYYTVLVEDEGVAEFVPIVPLCIQASTVAELEAAVNNNSRPCVQLTGPTYDLTSPLVVNRNSSLEITGSGGIYGAGGPIISSSLPSLSLIHISEPTRLLSISYAVFCLKKKKRRLR
eukprot:TRINITY_DN54613_c0_g1_i1.p1 TRINITY_DN54613_c0_g1~~TRINITY_DN54613_c0_g1_i1.p1  ORF type:complete len:355 (-),score=50.39 TRINITY_DN54613_c0_g1_i1:43-1107(-)